jgi:hypothetical protein
MADNKLAQKIREDKISLAERTLAVAKETLEDIEAAKHEASVKDLIAIFNAAVKTHRDLVSDIRDMEDAESDSERKLAVEYKSKVDELLGRFGK